MKSKMVFSFMDKCVLFSILVITGTAVGPVYGDSCADRVAANCNSMYPDWKCVTVNLPSVKLNDRVVNCRAVFAYLENPKTLYYAPPYTPGDNTERSGCDCQTNISPGLQASPSAVHPQSQCGSIIHNDNQSVGEKVPVVGTPFDLVYFSDRVLGRGGSYSLTVPHSSGMTGATVTVFGKQLTGIDEAAAGIKFFWDGTDSSGSLVPGQGLAHVEVTTTQPSLADFNSWWSCLNASCSYPLPTDSIATYDIPIGTYKAKSAGLGGWTLSIHHFYDVAANTIYLGDGSTRMVTAVKVDNGSHYAAGSEDGSLLFVFDLDGHHIKTLNALTGAALYTFSYDTQGYLNEVVDAYGNQTIVQRDVSGTLTGIQAPFGQITQLALNSYGYLATITNPNNEVYRATYVDSGGLLQTFKKPSGQTSTFIYNSDGLLQSDASSAGSSTVFSMGSSSDLLTHNFSTTSAMGYASSFQVFNIGTLSSRVETQGDGTQFKQQFNANDSLNIQDSGGFSQSIQYLPDLRFGSIANTVHSTSVSHGPNSWSYFSTQSLTGYAPGSDPLNPNFFNYQTIGTQEDINGNVWNTTYTLSTGLTEKVSPAGRHTQTTFDTYGKVSSIAEPGRAVVGLSYNTQGQLSQISQGSRSTAISYNAQGFVDHMTNAMNQSTSYSYDGAGRILTQTLPDTRVITYSYDSNGNLTSVTPPGRPAHSFSLNPFDLISQYLPPSLGGVSSPTQYFYNNDRQLTSVTRPDGTSINLSYDSSAGLLNSVTIPAGQYSFTYTNQKLTTAVSPDSIQIQRSYIGKLLTQEVTSGPGGTIGSIVRIWNHDLQISNSTAYAQSGIDSSAVDFNYDSDGLLTKAGEEVLALDPNSGALTGTTLDSVSDALTFDSTYGELSSHSATYTPTGGSPTALFAQTFTRDALSRIITKAETIAGTTSRYAYTYDSSGRLSVVTKNGNPYSSYNYDSNSNQVSGVNRNGAFSATYDAQDRLLTYGPVNARSFTYNANGERITSTMTSGGYQTTFAYDAFGNLKQVSYPTSAINPTPTTISYKMDGLGRRQSMTKNVSGSVVKQYQYLYEDQYRIGAILDGNGAMLYRFVYGSKPNVPDYMIKSGTRYKIISDPNGSVRLVVNSETGAISQQISYDEFGYVFWDSNPGYQPFGFAGGLYDPETGLTHFGARDYDASVGRWLQKDPILFAGGDANLFGYALQDPVNAIDPTGLATCVYDVQRHSMSCAASNGQTYFSSKFLSGQPVAQNNPQANILPNIGPIPPGVYRIGSQLPNSTRRNLTPLPGTNTFGRSGFQTHGCTNPITCSEGCVASPSIGPFNDFISNDPEPSTLIVQ